MMNERRHGCFRAATPAIAALAAMSLCPDAAKAGDVRVLSRATIDADTVRLGDIAVFDGFAVEFERRVRDVVLADAPRPGQSREIRATDVRGILQAAGANLVEIRIYGSSRCVVSRRRATSDPAKRVRKPIKHKPRKPLRRHADSIRAPAHDTLDAAVRDYIAVRLTPEDGRIEVALNRSTRSLREALDAKVAPGTYRIRERDPLRPGLCALDVEFVNNGEIVETVTVIGSIELIKPVLVARKPINRGSVVNQRDLKIEERRFTRIEDVGLSDMALAAGYEATRFIRPGEMLSLRVLRQKPLVKRGDIVRILVRGEGVRITTTGKAQRAGALGDVIPVARNGSHRKRDVIDAMVSGPGVVTYSGIQRVASR